MAVPCENCCPITPTIVVDKSNSTLQAIGTRNQHNWPEDFLIVALNTWSDIVDDGWSNPVSLRITWNLNTTTVKKQITVLSAVGDHSFDLSFMLSVVKGCNIFVVFASPDRKSFSLCDDLRNPFCRFANHDYCRNSHATLSSRAEAGSDYSIDGVILVCIWHNDSVILCTHINLSAFTVSTCCLVDVLTGLVSANKADSTDVRVFANVSDRVSPALDYVNNPTRNTCLLEQVN